MYTYKVSIEVSIGLPVTCNEETFRQCIKSIFAQTFSSWELIIVFDKEDDDLYQLASQIEDKRVRVFYDKQVKGLPNRLNQITRLSRGRYLARMDDDDLMLRKRLEIQVMQLRKNQSVDVLGTMSYLMDTDLKVYGRYREPELPTEYRGFFSSGILCHPSVVATRTWALTHPYDPQWIRTEDKELWIRSSSDTVFCKIQDFTMLIKVPRKLSPKKFHLTQKYDRRLVSFYAKTEGLRLFEARYVAMTYVKQFVFALTNILGLTSLVYRKKYVQISQKQIKTLEVEVEEILATRVPGWD